MFDGRDITQMPTHEIARLDLALSPEGRRIFGRMTVEENLRMGAEFAGHRDYEQRACPRHDGIPASQGAPAPAGRNAVGRRAADARHRPRIDEPPGNLLLDEPSLGLAPLIVKQIFNVIADLMRASASPCSWSSRTPSMRCELAHRAYVMVNGAITLSGTGQELLSSPEVRAAYLEGGARMEAAPNHPVEG